MQKIILREIKIQDLPDYLYWNHPSREFHKWNGPYFRQDSPEELEMKIETIRDDLLAGKSNVPTNRKIIADTETNEIIGEVNWYWKSRETLWMEIGIVIFNEKYWGKGIGSIALPLWINEIFTQFPELVRLGLSTWSGNERMIHLAEKIGLKKEATYRKARIVNEIFYDSLSYGILREEWEELGK